MNNEWFECKIKYEKTMENGLVKKVNEPYLVDALSFTEAEKRIIDEVSPFMTGEFQVSDIKRARYAEFFETIEESADRWRKLTFLVLSRYRNYQRGCLRVSGISIKHCTALCTRTGGIGGIFLIAAAHHLTGFPDLIASEKSNGIVTQLLLQLTFLWHPLSSQRIQLNQLIRSFS